MADLTGSTSRTIKISDGNENTPIVLPCPYPHSPFSFELQYIVTYKSENSSHAENSQKALPIKVLFKHHLDGWNKVYMMPNPIGAICTNEEWVSLKGELSSK